jgi:hypothetical protein
MKKAVFIVLALAIIWAIPGARNRIGVALLPVFERLGPVGEAAANPVRAFQARNDLSFILRILQDERTEGRQLPDERTFPDWIRRRMPQESGLDPWGNAYWLRRTGNVYVAGSNGPDGERDTEDDVVQQATI